MLSASSGFLWLFVLLSGRLTNFFDQRQNRPMLSKSTRFWICAQFCHPGLWQSLVGSRQCVSLVTWSVAWLLNGDAVRLLETLCWHLCFQWSQWWKSNVCVLGVSGRSLLSLQKREYKPINLSSVIGMWRKVEILRRKNLALSCRFHISVICAAL